MRKLGVNVAAATMAVLCLVGQAHAAGNDCWSGQEVAAAKIRNLQSMLMVAALRCHGSQVDVLADYNRFVNANRAAIVQANNSLKSYFTRTSGGAEGQRRYDRFTTALANTFGAGGSDGETCSDMASIARTAQDARGSFAQLVQIADREGLEPAMPTRNCPMAIAAK